MALVITPWYDLPRFWPIQYGYCTVQVPVLALIPVQKATSGLGTTRRNGKRK
jgi:hypothetical protein